jgi:hypothetical protein
MPINPLDRHAIAPAMCAARQRVDVFSVPGSAMVMLISRSQEPGFLKLRPWSEEEKKGGDICVPFLSASLWRRSLCGLGA